MSKRKKKSQPHFTPYVRGFKPPTLAGKRAALACTDTAYSFTGHQSLPRCTSPDDWLAQYKEPGQTVAEFTEENPWFSRRKWKYVKQTFISTGTTILEKYPDGKLYLLPLGDLGVDVDKLARFAEAYLGVAFSVLPAVEMGRTGRRVWFKRGSERWPVQARVAQNGRLQLNVTAALKEVRHHLEVHNKSSLCVVALTQHELYDTKSDLFVAGMASGNQRIAVFSLLRYDPNLTFSPEFWYEVGEVATPLSPSETKKVILERSLKLLVHETMHLLGLDHCIYFQCVMNGAGHLEEDFRQPMYLCPVCLRKLALLVGLDVVQRYRTLEGLYQELGMREELQWVHKRLELIVK